MGDSREDTQDLLQILTNFSLFILPVYERKSAFRVRSRLIISTPCEMQGRRVDVANFEHQTSTTPRHKSLPLFGVSLLHIMLHDISPTKFQLRS